MRYASVPAEVKVPVVIALVQVVLFHPIFEGLQIPDPFAPSYDFAVPLGSQKIMAENFFRIFWIWSVVESFQFSGIMGDKYRLLEMNCYFPFLIGAEIITIFQV